MNAHHSRRCSHPGLQDGACAKLYLYCIFDTKEERLDSEWHAYMDCPLHGSARREFILLVLSVMSFFEGLEMEVAIFLSSPSVFA